MAARLAIYWLIFLVAFIWGMATIAARIWPFEIIRVIVVYVQGGLGEETSLRDKISNDLGFRPVRWIRTAPGDLDTLPEVQIPGLKDRRTMPRMALSDDAPKGYRAVFGAFDFEENFWGAFLFDPDGALVRTWVFSTDDLPLSEEPGIRKNTYGLSMQPDGSIIFSQQEAGGGLVKVNACGERDWVLEGLYHHVVSPTERGTFWTYEGTQQQFDHILMEIDIESGEVVRQIDMQDVREANPNVHIFDLQRQEEVSDRTHGNDIEELPTALADAFPEFEAGDLVQSLRVPNLLFVIDPDTLKIKWWRIGPWDRQHDPDWQPDGRITVFSNNERGVGDYSKIVSIVPQTYETEVLLDGADHGFFSEFNGQHQMTPGGGILITSSHQGRIFEVDGDGNVVFDFLNLYRGEGNQTLHVADAKWFAPDYFEPGTWASCDAN